MTLQDIFDKLTFGELSQIGVSGNGTGISQEDYPKLISHVNLGLTDLYTKFPLREREVVIQQYDEISFYELDITHAQSNTMPTSGRSNPFSFKYTSVKYLLAQIS